MQIKIIIKSNGKNFFQIDWIESYTWRFCWDFGGYVIHVN